MDTKNLNIIEDLSLDELGKALIEALRGKSDPFDTATIVFPSLKMEQWFKAFWLRNQDNVLANIKCQNINSFLSDIIYVNEKNYSLVKSNEIRNQIIKYLPNTNDKDFKKYIYDDNELNPIKLFDLANLLTKLFRQYDEDMFTPTGEQLNIYNYVNNELAKSNLATLRYKYSLKDNFKNYGPIIFFGISKLSKLQQEIIEGYAKEADTYMYLLKDNVDRIGSKYSLITAPSMLREIEAIHTEIANLLKDKENKYSDFLVLSTDITKYENIISRVFKQDNVNFYDIPFSITNRRKDNGDITVILEKLFEISNKGFFTRLDFFEIVNNPLIKQVRGIDDEEVENWMNSIVELNVYRKHKDIDDWEYAKKRLILSKLSDINNINENVVDLTNDEYLPYSNIGFSDDSIVRIVKVIDDLQSWLKNSSNINVASKSNIEIIKSELNKWFSILNDDELETNILYKPMLKEMDSWMELELTNVPIDTLMFALIESSKVSVSTSNTFFTSGVTFTNFDESSILSAKYIFFLGMDNKSIPIVQVKNELDQRPDNKNELEEIKDSFYKQYRNANEHFYMSFVNLDLKTDEEFYPSTLIIELANKVIPKDIKMEEFLSKEKYGFTKKINIDEKRSWSELFTKREYKNREYYYGLLNGNNVNSSANSQYKHEIMKKISISNIARFLEEPLKFKAGILFGSNDELDENIKDEYEPFGLDNLSRSILISEMASDILRGNVDPLNVTQRNRLKEKYNLEHRLPDICDELNESTFEYLFNVASETAKIIKGIHQDFEVVDFNDLELLTQYNGEDVSWLLTSKKPIVRETNGCSRSYSEIKEFKSGKYSDLLTLYVASLRDIAEINDHETYKVTIHRAASATFEVTPDKARELLNKMYALMNDYSDNYFLAINLLMVKRYEFKELRKEVYGGDGTNWNYYNDRAIFDAETQLGYNEEEFIEQRNERIHALLDELILYDVTVKLDEY